VTRQINLDPVGNEDDLSGLSLLEGFEEFLHGRDGEVAAGEDVAVALPASDGVAGGVGLTAEGLFGLLGRGHRAEHQHRQPH
jgi:hypothetical protein